MKYILGLFLIGCIAVSWYLETHPMEAFMLMIKLASLLHIQVIQ